MSTLRFIDRTGNEIIIEMKGFGPTPREKECSSI